MAFIRRPKILVLLDTWFIRRMWVHSFDQKSLWNGNIRYKHFGNRLRSMNKELSILLQWARLCWETSQFSQWLDTSLVNTSWALLALLITNALSPPPPHPHPTTTGLIPYSVHYTMLVCWTYIHLPDNVWAPYLPAPCSAPQSWGDCCVLRPYPPRSSTSAVKVQGSEMMNVEAVGLDLTSNSLGLLLKRGLVLLTSQQHLLNVDQGTLSHHCA